MASTLARLKSALATQPARCLPRLLRSDAAATGPATWLWPARARRKPLRQPPQAHLVRIIEYTATVAVGGRIRTEASRLATTLLEARQARLPGSPRPVTNAGKSTSGHGARGHLDAEGS
jgi:hypothetical protein